MKKFTLFTLISFILMNIIYLKLTPIYYENTVEMDSLDEESNFESIAYSTRAAPNYMVTYFSNLNDNMAYNFGSSCVFVALSSVLSYYDSWYNDDFVPEHFDVKSTATSINAALNTSPGIITVSSEFDTRIGTLDEAFDSIITNKYNDFSCYLMWYSFNNLNTGSNTIGNISTKNLQILLDYIYGDNYINLISVGITSTGQQDSSVSQKQKINFIKSCIDQGKPCIVSISGNTTTNTNNHSRHAVVAYDYDGDDIFANFGWRDNDNTQYHRMLNDDVSGITYNAINYAVAFDINPTFRPHSNNYVVFESGSYNYYCYNGLLNDEEAMHKHPIGHSSNTSTHTFECPTCHYSFCIGHTNVTYSSGGNLKHTKNCSSIYCSSVSENHRFTYERRTNYHKEICVDCGFIQNISHTYGTYTINDRNNASITQQRCIYCGQLRS